MLADDNSECIYYRLNKYYVHNVIFILERKEA